MAVALNLFRCLFCRAVAGTSGVGGQSGAWWPQGVLLRAGGADRGFLGFGQWRLPQSLQPPQWLLFRDFRRSAVLVVVLLPSFFKRTLARLLRL